MQASRPGAAGAVPSRRAGVGGTRPEGRGKRRAGERQRRGRRRGPAGKRAARDGSVSAGFCDPAGELATGAGGWGVAPGRRVRRDGGTNAPSARLRLGGAGSRDRPERRGPRAELRGPAPRQ